MWPAGGACPFAVGVPDDTVVLRREIPRFPYVPPGREARNERCAEVYHIQVAGLAGRLSATGTDRVVIGVSGGLDSTQALIVAGKTMDRLGLPRANVLAYTMPGFATSAHTLANAHRLMKALGVSAHEIDIRPSATQMLEDLDHPAARGEPVYDVTFENVQAGERTSHLFRLANHHGGLVVGTGDLSELALGWCTYGVGDHMAHYNVNASVPKTLIQHLIRWTIDAGEVDDEAADVLGSILATEISPELVPASTGAEDGRPAQRSEDVVGPYELQDFHLYHLLRFGYRPSRIAYLAQQAWGDRTPRGVARPDPAGGSPRVRPGHHQALAGRVPPPLLRDEPVQALGPAQRPQGRLGRRPVAPGRLAGPERRPRPGLARRAGPQRPRLNVTTGSDCRRRLSWHKVRLKVGRSVEAGASGRG